MRQVPNLRYTARGLPHSMHRRIVRVENFGGRFAAAILDLLAIIFTNRHYLNIDGIRLFTELLRRSSSFLLSFLHGKPHRSQQDSGIIITMSCCHQGNIHTLRAGELVRIDFRKNHLL